MQKLLLVYYHLETRSTSQIWKSKYGFSPDLGGKMAAFWACACKLSWTLLSPARVQPLYGAGSKESSGTGLRFSRLWIWREITRGERCMSICDRGTGAQQFRGLVMSEIHRWWTPTVLQILKFSFVGNDRRPSQKSGTRRENRNALDYPDICWDIYDFEFSLVGKIRDDREKVKSQTVWDFHNIWKSGLRVFSRYTKWIVLHDELSVLYPSCSWTQVDPDG